MPAFVTYQQFAEARQRQLVTDSVLARVLLGANEQINCGNCISAFGSVGSFTAGVHGRFYLSDSVSILGGVALTQYEERGVKVEGSPIFALALRYDPVEFGASRPFFELGGFALPGQRVRYTRANFDGIDAGVVRQKSTVDTVAIFARAGWVFRLSPVDEFAVFADVTREMQHVRQRDDAFFTANSGLLAATGTDILHVARAGAQYTHLFGTSIEGNLNGAVAHSFASTSPLDAIISGLRGRGTALRDVTWFEYGARVGYRFSNAWTVDLFGNGTAGERPIGFTLHGGVGLRSSF